MYVASSDRDESGSTPIHLDATGAVNILVYAAGCFIPHVSMIDYDVLSFPPAPVMIHTGERGRVQRMIVRLGGWTVNDGWRRRGISWRE